MSGYPSWRAVCEVVMDTLRQEGCDPADYYVAGIMRDAFYGRGRPYGYGAHDAATWRAAEARHARRRPASVTTKEDTS